MTQHDEMDITSYLQTEGRRLAGRCLRTASASTSASRTGGAVQLQQGSNPSASAAAIDGAFVPYSLSEALYRMELEKRQRGLVR